jgi:DNA repair protein RadD
VATPVYPTIGGKTQASNITVSPTVAPTLWKFQDIAVGQLRTAIRELRQAGKQPRILLVSPTGSGKSFIFAWMMLAAIAKGLKVLAVVNRRELCKDLSRRLFRLGVMHGVIMGDHPSRPWLTVQVASIDTLHRRSNVPPADLIFLDEAHFSISPIWSKVVERYPDVPLIGGTATPCRADGRGLGDLYNAMVLCPGTAELTELGHLAPARVFAPAEIDLTGVKTTAGDYNQKDLAKAVDRSKLVGDIVEHWQRLASGRPTVVFAVNVEHSKHIRDQFIAAGITAQHVDANTPDGERDQLWSDLASGAVQVCTSVGVISYGWDVPAVSCAILARPTKSLALYLQQIGRVLRTAPGKTEALVLDHAGCVLEHGLPDEERDWSLAGAKRKPKEVDRAALAVRMCLTCWCAFSSRLQACPACGAVYQRKVEPIKTVAGELQEVTGKPMKISADPVRAWHQQQARERGWKPGSVYFRYEEFIAGAENAPAEVIETWREYMRSTGRAHVVAERDAIVARGQQIAAAAQIAYSEVAV